MVRRRVLACVWVAASVGPGLSACQSFTDVPVTFVSGLRVLGIKADPPEAPPGASTTVSALAVDTSGGTPAATWTACLQPPLAGQAVNPDCVTVRSAPYLQSLGAGLTISTVMPDVSASSLGAPDATGGVYVPLVADVTSADAASAGAIAAVYRLRVGGTAPPNANPTIATVYALDASGARSPIDAAQPMLVTSGQAISLGATFAPDSAQTYTAADGTTRTETLTTSWFCTAGELSVEKTSGIQPETVLRLDRRLPAPGTPIDLYAIGRDERGGADFAHRTLMLQ